MVLGHRGRAHPAFGVGYRSDGGGLVDRVSANRIRRRRDHLGGFQPRRPHHTAAPARCKRLWRGGLHGGAGSLRLWSRRGGPVEIPHRDVPCRRLSGGNEIDGVMVGIHRSRPYVRDPAGSIDHRLRPPAPHHRPRTAALANGDAGRGGTDCGRAPSSPSRRFGPAPIWLSARSARIRATRSLSSPTADRGWPVSAISGTCGSSTPCGPGCRCSSSPVGSHEATRAWGPPGSSPSGRSESQGPSDAYWAVGRQTVSVAPGGGGGAGDQRNLLRGITTVLRRPDAASRGLPLGVGYRCHRRLRCLLHCAQRDDGHPVRRHGLDRTDRNRFPADCCHHPTRSCRRRTDRLAIRLPASCTRPAARCQGDVGPTQPPPTQGGQQ